MKLGLAWRIGGVIALIGVLGTVLAGYYGYAASRQLLVAGAEARLQTATRVLARQLSLALDAGARDVLLFARHPVAARMMTRSDAPELLARSERNTELLLEGMLRTHPEYLRLRLISAGEHGLERLRVDRQGTQLRRIAEDERLEKGHQAYVYETLRLAPGEIYLSGARLRADAEAEGGPRPTLQIAAAIHDAHLQSVGVVVVDIDLDSLFKQLGADLPAGLRLYLLNRHGDYLIHPEATRAFAFDRGQRAHVNDDYPAARALLEGQAGRPRELVTASPQGQMAAFVRQPATEARLDEVFIVGLSQPLADVLQEADRLGLLVLRNGLGLSLLAVLLAALLARALTRPLLQIVRSVQRFAEDPNAEAALPQRRGDEIGLLARSVHAMQQQIRNQFGKLQSKQDELDSLASRDSLTGLLNRRVFLDRLEHALAQARRGQGSLALLFVDLDRFKSINDQHGHPTGDAVLQVVAQRLQQLVREADTVARIGGDEFVVLIEHAEADAAAGAVAAKLRLALMQPIAIGELRLQAGASIGIGRYPGDGSTVDELLGAADRAMYRAKFGDTA